MYQQLSERLISIVVRGEKSCLNIGGFSPRVSTQSPFYRHKACLAECLENWLVVRVVADTGGFR